MFTLHQETIDTIKIYLSKVDGRLIEDITDKDVFEYLSDKEWDEKDDCIVNPSSNIEDWVYIKPRNRMQIALDICSSIKDPENYLSFI
jgi:hypothetical protein